MTFRAIILRRAFVWALMLTFPSVVEAKSLYRYRNAEGKPAATYEESDFRQGIADGRQLARSYPLARHGHSATNGDVLGFDRLHHPFFGLLGTLVPVGIEVGQRPRRQAVEEHAKADGRSYDGKDRRSSLGLSVDHDRPDEHQRCDSPRAEPSDVRDGWQR